MYLCPRILVCTYSEAMADVSANVDGKQRARAEAKGSKRLEADGWVASFQT